MGCGGGWIIDVYVVDCGGDWGWWFLLLLALSALGYVGGSVAVNHKSRGMPLDRTALPHPVRAQRPPPPPLCCTWIAVSSQMELRFVRGPTI
eukprot:COSAG04_NODE_176_length_21411_cov_10.599240_24_plen_92_part_00